MTKLNDWLNGLLTVNNAINVDVTFTTPRTEVYFIGCHYQNEQQTDVLYLLGHWPNDFPKLHNRGNVMYRDNIDGSLWYLAAYANESCLNEPYVQYHPFGLTFMLHKLGKNPDTGKYFDLDGMGNESYRKIDMTIK